MGTSVRPPISPGIDSALMAMNSAVAAIAADVDSLAAPQLELLVPALAATMSRFQAVRLAALAAADRARVADRSGMRSTADWAAAVSGEKRGTMRGDCELAGRLAARPAFADALAAGAVSKAQATVLSGAVEPSDTEQRQLLDHAAQSSVNELERHVARFNLDRSRPTDPVVPAVTITPTTGGVKADVCLDALGGELFTTAVDAAAQKLSFDAGTPLSRRRADGLAAICRYFLEHHTAVTHRLGRPHVVVVMPVELATNETASGAATVASGAVIDAATARHLACDASVSRLVTGPASEPLDIGRASRSIPAPMARQLVVEDRHCRWPGCQSPAWACEGHHVEWWSSPYRGETKLSNLILLCWHHHHLLHKDRGWQLTLDPATRHLTVEYHDRLIGTSHPPGRRRPAEPVVAPAPPEPDFTPAEQAQLFDDHGDRAPARSLGAAVAHPLATSSSTSAWHGSSSGQ
jgi:hypothetical protein